MKALIVINETYWPKPSFDYNYEIVTLTDSIIDETDYTYGIILRKIMVVFADGRRVYIPSDYLRELTDQAVLDIEDAKLRRTRAQVDLEVISNGLNKINV